MLYFKASDQCLRMLLPRLAIWRVISGVGKAFSLPAFSVHNGLRKFRVREKLTVVFHVIAPSINETEFQPPQSSPGNMIVMAGCGSSKSNGPTNGGEGH